MHPLALVSLERCPGDIRTYMDIGLIGIFPSGKTTMFGARGIMTGFVHGMWVILQAS
jgi:hypothetical protein